MEEVGLEESTTISGRDTSEIAGVIMDRRSKERDCDRAVNVSAPDDPVESSLSFYAGMRDFCLPRDGGSRGGS